MAFRFKSNQIIAAIVVIMYIQKYFQNLHHFQGEAIHPFESVRLAGDRRLIHSAEDQLMYSRYDLPSAQNVVCNWQHATNVFWIYFIFSTTSSDILYNVHTVRNVCIYDHR